ncbi:hypothetical protein [Roseivirga seohaensis]|uniref:Yip1 domain-containing protein n=1 Tax=Roseivirga seohaensis subsp. aquiponti TaxID=1566026 RepID=A0A0L8AK64_9BACT|nr:hypothetical protein [Roseivirga seohaensis]KOF02540.1 hypothetical protein OB69_11455 [Roseivirga seohaensis subsp. aquiponti]
MPREYTPLEVKMKEYTSINKTMVFILMCIISTLLLYIQQTFILYEITAFKFMDGVDLMILKAISGLKYLGIPIMFALKFTVTGFILWTGCFLWGYKVTYKQCWQIAMFAEMIFFIPEILTILWFFFIDVDPTYQDFLAFEPLSYMNFFNHEEVPEKYWYVNSALNVFEVGYWILLTYGINFAARKKKSIANAIVFTSYVPLFLLWLWFYLGVYK